MTLLFSVSAPISVMLKSATPNPVRTIGSAVNLTCVVYVELGFAVDVPVIVSTVWAGPNGFTASDTSQPISGISSTMYYNTSRAVIISFERSQSGVYTCTVTLIPNSYTRSHLIDSVTTSGSIRVTIGERVTLIIIINNYFDCC